MARRQQSPLDVVIEDLALPRSGARTAAGGASLAFGYLADHTDVGPLRRHQLLLPRLRRTDPLRRTPLPTHVPRPAPTNRPPNTATSPGRHPARRRTGPRAFRQQPGRRRPRLGRRPFRRRRRAAPTGAIFLPSRLADNPHLDQRRLRRNPRPSSPRRTRAAAERRLGDPRRRRAVQARLVPDSSNPPRSRRTPFQSATGTSPAPTPSPPTATPTGPSDSNSRCTQRPASSTSPTSSATAKHPERSNNSSRATAERDGASVPIVIEQEPGAAGKADHRPLQTPRPARLPPPQRPPDRRQRHPRPPRRRRRRKRAHQARPRPPHPPVPRRTHRLPARPPRRLRRRALRRPHLPGKPQPPPRPRLRRHPNPDQPTRASRFPHLIPQRRAALRTTRKPARRPNLEQLAALTATYLGVVWKTIEMKPTTAAAPWPNDRPNSNPLLAGDSGRAVARCVPSHHGLRGLSS